MVSAASSVTVPISTMRPARMPTSAGRPGAPVPSTTEPPLITQSSIGRLPSEIERVPFWRQKPHQTRSAAAGGAFGGVEGLAAGGLGRGPGGPLVRGGGAALGFQDLALLEQACPLGILVALLAGNLGHETEARQFGVAGVFVGGGNFGQGE